jgi:membrane-associated protease RseP (regulator of RpoE activity)
MNIRLFRQLQSDSATHPFRFDSTTPAMYHGQNSPSLSADESLASEPALIDEISLTEGKNFDALGVNGETVPSFYQSYYQIPHGLHIADITPEGAADTAGLQEGDILLSLNGTPITDTEALHALINSFQPGDTVVASVYRNGQQYNITITITVAETEGSEVTE